jgi:hypothetical protein
MYNNKLYRTAENLSEKFIVPSNVQKIAQEGYDWGRNNRNYCSSKQLELSRILAMQNMIKLSDIIDIHEYTAKNRFRIPSDPDRKEAWIWKMYGGEEARRWSEYIVRVNSKKHLKV